MSFLNKISCSVKSLFAKHSKKDFVECDKEQRENMSQKQIDKTIKDSFPASDPPSTY